MHMVFHYFEFHYLYTFPFTDRSYLRFYYVRYLSFENPKPVFGCPYNMVAPLVHYKG